LSTRRIGVLYTTEKGLGVEGGVRRAKITAVHRGANRTILFRPIQLVIPLLVVQGREDVYDPLLHLSLRYIVPFTKSHSILESLFFLSVLKQDGEVYAVSLFH
jgi:hypothetical protein